LKGGKEKKKMSVNFDKHSIEKRHNKRYLGIFLMFVVIAVVVGFIGVFSVARMSGYSVFDIFKATQSPVSGPIQAPTTPESGGPIQAPITQAVISKQVGQNITYQGVLDMLNRCFIEPSNTGQINMTCNAVCENVNYGIDYKCINGFITDNDARNLVKGRPVSCGNKLSGAYQTLWCNCCSTSVLGPGWRGGDELPPQGYGPGWR